LRCEQRGHIERLGQDICPDHPGLTEERIHCNVRSSNESVLIPTAGEDAAPGTATIRVHSLVTNHAVVSRGFAPVLIDLPDLDEVIPFDRRRLGRVGRGIEPSVEFVAFVRALHRRRFDIAIDLQGLFRSGFLAMASGAPVRLGFRPAREFAGLFYTHRIDLADPEIHAADKNYLVARRLAFDHLPMSFDLGVTADDRDGAARLRRDAGMEPDAPYYAVFPGARWETKRWDPARFAAA